MKKTRAGAGILLIKGRLKDISPLSISRMTRFEDNNLKL
jgi:hypothetical protein